VRAFLTKRVEAGRAGGSVADWLSAVVTAVSAAIAVYAVYWARRSARGTFAHTGYELARTLHADLTTGATAQARDVLEHFRSGTRYHEPGPAGLPPTASTQEVLEAYFALLWCFERILIGRRTLSRVGDWRGGSCSVSSPRHFKPYVRFSRIRLSDIVHRLACTVALCTVPVRR